MRIVYTSPRRDLWYYHERGVWAVVTTNKQVKKDGTAVMGAGIAKQCAERFPDVPRRYAEYLDREVHVVFLEDHRLVLLPTKDHWRQDSDLQLIAASLERFVLAAGNHPHVPESFAPLHFAFPPLGCGNGNLDWKTQVCPLMEKYLTEDRFVAVLPEAWKP